MNLPLSNLTPCELDVLQALTEYQRECPPYWGMSKTIAATMDMSRAQLCQVLCTLVGSGHVRRLRRGLYEAVTR